MESPISRIAARDAVTLQRLSDRNRKRKFLVPRRPSEDDDSERREPSEEPSVVLEPRPRVAAPGVAVSRARLEDEAGQQIDIEG